MEIVQFIYGNDSVDFMPVGNDNVMVNATQMAKIIGKRVDVFLKSDHAKAFINALEFTPYGVNSERLTKDQIIQTRGQSGTWMHRILALKFAAWLDPYFEVWVYSTIEKIILGHYRDMKEATIEKLVAEKELAEKKEELIRTNPQLAEIFELELRIMAADKKRMKALKASTSQLKFDLFNEVKK